MEENVKSSKKHFSKLGWMFFAGTLIIYAAQMIPMGIVGVLKPEWLEDANISLLLSVLPLYLVGMPLLILLVKQVPATEVEKKKMTWWQFVLSAIICYGLVYCTNIIGNILTFIIGLLKGSIVQNQIMNIASSVSLVFVLIYMVICAPFIEEYVFRKLIVDRTVKYGQGVAVLLSGLMFGLFHGNLNQFVYAFALGCFLAFLYVKTGKLKITIALHCMINFVGGFLSTILLDMIDLEQYQEIMANGMDVDALMAYMSENMVGLVLYAMLGLFVAATIIAGFVLVIVALVKKKITFESGEVVLPKGKRFSTVLWNWGMGCYCVFWIVMIILQLWM